VLDIKTYNLGVAKQLFTELLEILNKYGDYSVHNQKGMIMDILDIIDSDIDEEQKFAEVKSRYKDLYLRAAKGGLSEFYIHRDDFEERKALNEPLDNIDDMLWDMFQP
jgi:hypothetical protein